MSTPPGARAAGGGDRKKLMAAACAGTFVFGVAIAMLGATLPVLFGKIGFDKARGGQPVHDRDRRHARHVAALRPAGRSVRFQDVPDCERAAGCGRIRR